MEEKKRRSLGSPGLAIEDVEAFDPNCAMTRDEMVETGLARLGGRWVRVQGCTDTGAKSQDSELHHVPPAVRDRRSHRSAPFRVGVGRKQVMAFGERVQRRREAGVNGGLHQYLDNLGAAQTEIETGRDMDA